MRQYEFNNLPFTLLPQEEDTGSVLHPIISDLVFTPAGSFDVTNITLMTTGTFVLIAIIIFIICFKCDRLRLSSWQLLTGCWEKFFTCVTSRSFRAKRDNRRLRRECEVRRQEISENLQDLELFNRALNHHPNISRSASALDRIRPHTVTFQPEGSVISLQD